MKFFAGLIVLCLQRKRRSRRFRRRRRRDVVIGKAMCASWVECFCVIRRWCRRPGRSTCTPLTRRRWPKPRRSSPPARPTCSTRRRACKCTPPIGSGPPAATVRCFLLFIIFKFQFSIYFFSLFVLTGQDGQDSSCISLFICFALYVNNEWNLA